MKQFEDRAAILQKVELIQAESTKEDFHFFPQNW
jgi:hypothetical protein